MPPSSRGQGAACTASKKTNKGQRTIASGNKVAGKRSGKNAGKHASPKGKGPKAAPKGKGQKAEKDLETPEKAAPKGNGQKASKDLKTPEKAEAGLKMEMKNVRSRAYHGVVRDALARRLASAVGVVLTRAVFFCVYHDCLGWRCRILRRGRTQPSTTALCTLALFGTCTSFSVLG